MGVQQRQIQVNLGLVIFRVSYCCISPLDLTKSWQTVACGLKLAHSLFLYYLPAKKAATACKEFVTENVCFLKGMKYILFGFLQETR